MTLRDTALSMGFYNAVDFSPRLLKCTQELRSLCKSCKAYGSCWICPPNCPDIARMQENLDSYDNAMLVISRHCPADPFDEKLTLKLGHEHSMRVLKLSEGLSRRYVLTAGNCQICEKCAFPDSPCRNAHLNFGSISAHGINMAELCKALGVSGEFKRDEVSFMGIILW